MDYLDAIMEILDAVGRIKLPHHRLDLVTVARREFAKRGGCDSKFIAPIESTLRECLRKLSLEQKREIWLSPETGAAATAGSEACDEASIDMDLEGELMYRYAGSEIRARFEAEAEPMLSQVRATPDDWTWSYHRDPDHLLANRRAALDTFLADYERGLRDCRYVVGELPSLPFFSH